MNAMKYCKHCGEQIDADCVVCPKCGKQVEQLSASYNTNYNNYYPNHDQKSIVNAPSKWIKTRFAFGVTNLSLGIFFMSVIFSSEGGLANNPRMLVSAWFFITTAIITIIGKKSKGLTITSIVFYSFGILYNLMACFIVPSHIFFVLIMTIFLTLTCVSLKDYRSFIK